MQHIVAHVRSVDQSVVMPFAKHFPERTKQGEEVEEHINTEASETHRHIRDCQGWQHCVVIPLAKHLAETTGKVERAKECVVQVEKTNECVVPGQRTEGGRTKVR